MSTTYTVTGMTCGHCVASVKEEVGEVPGVTDVEVDLPTGRVEIAGAADDALIRKAIEEAGYSVA
ncbi:heavy-metal-associated domain-containing protein [Nonomuraea longicatena]|uniref:Heavy-metal-associated domain-containing protein n=1 Tax=Nonomuraea longicatena TaxID=83682 RepID=A0ABP4B5X4_9ACTN